MAKCGGNRLRTYAKIKNIYRVEPYLELLLPVKYKNSIANFRISTHKLEIEVGRYKKPIPKPAEERICRQCSSGEVEDEVHFMFTCEKYRDLMSDFLSKIEQLGFTGSTNGVEGLRDLFQLDDPAALFNIGVYITRCMEMRV